MGIFHSKGCRWIGEINCAAYRYREHQGDILYFPWEHLGGSYQGRILILNFRDSRKDLI